MRQQFRTTGLITVLATALFACSKGEDIVATEEVDGAFAPVVEPLDRAAEVQAITDERKKSLDEALEEAEGGNP